MEATRAIDEAAAALEEFPALVSLAEGNFSRAAGRVTSVLKDQFESKRRMLERLPSRLKLLSTQPRQSG